MMKGFFFLRHVNETGWNTNVRKWLNGYFCCFYIYKLYQNFFFGMMFTLILKCLLSDGWQSQKYFFKTANC